MKFEVDTDTILQIVKDKMFSNLETSIRSKEGLTEEEIQATLVLNKKKVATDAQALAAFFTSLYVTEPTL